MFILRLEIPADRLGKNTERKGRGTQLLHLAPGTRQAWVRKYVARQVSKPQHAGQRTKKGSPGHWKAPGTMWRGRSLEEQAHKAGQKRHPAPP